MNFPELITIRAAPILKLQVVPTTDIWRHQSPTGATPMANRRVTTWQRPKKEIDTGSVDLQGSGKPLKTICGR